MTLDQLRVFIAVAERLNVTKAADVLCVTQSAASASIAALEAQHGVLLFNRVGRGIQLSDAGRVFLPEARAVLQQAATALQSLDDLTSLVHGRLVIGASQTIANYWLPRYLARFSLRHPNIKLNLLIGNTTQIAQHVLDGKANLGLVEGEVDMSMLRRRRIGEDRIAIYVAPSHPLANVNVTIKDLAEARWALRESGSGTRAAFERALGAKGIDPIDLHVSLELPSNEAALAAVADGALVTVVSELAAQPLLAAGRLKQLVVELPARGFELLTHQERSQSAAHKAFMQEVWNDLDSVPKFNNIKNQVASRKTKYKESKITATPATLKNRAYD